MSTDRLAGDTPPEQEAAPGTADAQAPAAAAAPGGSTEPAAAAATPSGEAAAPGEAVASDDDTTAPGNGPAEAAPGDATAAAAPGNAGAAEDGRTPTQGAAGPGEDAAASGPEAAAPGSEARTAPAGAARDTAASGSAQATAAALAAAVRAVESGERSAASFFNAPRPAKPAAPAGRPAQGAPSPGSPAPQDRPAGPAPEPARQQPAPEPGGPARPPVVDGDATGPASGAAAPTSPAAAPGPGSYAPGAEGVRQVLAAGDAPEALADRAAEVLGERAAEALREDPWQLLAVPGVRPEQADGFARALLGPACGPGDERRAQALVGWLLEQAAVAGHSALEASALRAALAQRAVPDPDDALQTAIADGAVLVFQDAIEEPGRPRPVTDEDGEEAQPVRILLGLDRFAMAEESVADGLARLLNTFEAAAGPEDHPADGPTPDEDATAEDATEAELAPATDEGRPAAETDTTPAADNGTEAGAEAGRPAGHADGTTDHTTDDTTVARPAHPSPAEWEAAAAAAPSPSAAELIRAAAHSGLVAHTGAEAARAEPAALLAAARSLGLRAFGATHTENGRRRLAADLTEGAPGDTANGTAAVTVSALLSGQQGPGRDADGALALDLLVVLDAPQLDLETAALLVESLPDGTRLVLSGDPGVLWSAGPGRLFADLLAARFCPQVASRTPDFGPIGELVSGIGIGELSQVEAPGKEVVIVPVRDAKEAVHRTVQLVADSVPRALGVPADRTQVITVGHGGAAGTRALNAALKERLNPGPGRFGGFDPGDRVAYAPAPAPGRTVPGTVTGADAAGLRLDCDGAAVVVPREQVGAGAVRHGWALTAHQAAGMRWPAAVVVLPGDAAGGLTRAWVYTAFSRGERHLSVVQGVDQALPRAVAEVPVKERTTRLRTLLQQSVQTTQEPSTAD
ncbi:helix-hairpin-helix domain-containing protein [Streptomyces sp. C184]|uniref:helix-hairpin-helix domain-containing protein n=1 Tax=Streptomyces sp. C184 TaxID=3237121 RepID=UPI0034C5D783